MGKRLILIILGFLSTLNLWAQHDLQSGPYQFQYWDAASPAGTYPSDMHFYFLATTSDPQISDTLADIYQLAYNLTNSSRIRGVGQDGFSMFNTASSTHHPLGYQLGAAVLQLNTIDRYNITLDWTAKTIQSGGRTYALQLFYRIGNQGSWILAEYDNNTPVIYIDAGSNNNEGVLDTWTFPTILEDEPHIELMWKYFEHSSSTAQGGRSHLSIKNIEIHSQGDNEPEFDWISQNELTIQQAGNESVDSVLLKGINWNLDIDLSVNTPFEISFNPNAGFNNQIEYTSTQILEDSVMIYFKNTNPSIAWSTMNMEAQSGGQSSNYEHAWYYTDAFLPEALILADTHYFFTEWSPDQPAGTYPDHMSFQMAMGDDYASMSLPLPYDWTCAYDLTGRSRFNGEDDWGITFRNTATPQWDDCNGNGEDLNQFVGATTLVINTENVDSAILSYYIMMFEQANVEENRKYAVDLQYRLHPTDTFQSFSDSTFHPAFDVLNYDEHFMHIRLPEPLLHQQFVQFRWLYADTHYPNGFGARPVYRLDEISVINLDLSLDDDISINEPEIPSLNKIYPNPISRNGILYFEKAFSGVVYDMTGQVIKNLEQTNSWDFKGLHPGMYILKSFNGEISKLIIY